MRTVFIAFGIIAVCVDFFLLATTPVSACDKHLAGIVTRVRDGDTIVVGKTPVRLMGIAAPESHEMHGPEATMTMKKMVLGKHVECCLSRESSFDRVIATCYRDGLDMARFLVSAGLARDCARFSKGRYANFENFISRRLPLPAYCLDRPSR
jgi:micrococcal nuclease